MKITLIGCGNMGLVYARAFLKYQLTTTNDLLLVEKNTARQEQLQSLNLGNVVTLEHPAVKESELILLAVKPQDFHALAPQLKNIFQPGALLISIMAGITLQTLCEKLNHQKVVRAMPNAPVELGMGFTGFCASAAVDAPALRKTEHILNTTGRSYYFDNEDLLNAVTAISGSGPAYFFWFAEQLTTAAKNMGLEDHVAQMMVRQTMLGSFHQLNNSTKTAGELIDMVASKGGTTEAALNVLRENKAGEIIQKALTAAERRGAELAG